MNSRFALLFATIVGLVWTSASQTAHAQTIQPTGPVQQVHTGFQFTEGPAAMDDGTLYFTDIPNTAIHRLSADGKLSLLTNQSNHSNGLWPLSNTKLLACEMDGAVVMHDLSGDSAKRIVLADSYNGKRFNACNDLVVDNHGGLYFTDPQYRAPEPWPQTERCVYYIANFETDPKVTRLTGDIEAPNGIGLSPNGKTLYVIPSMQAEMLAYDVLAPGKIGPQRVLCKVQQVEGETSRGGDGMAIDVDGNLYITTHLGIQIFSSEGEARGIVAFPEIPANVTFGGPEFKTMYATARKSLYSVEMPIAGFREFPAN
ncbi:MAG TPA: SMP-30/gluconolactonase/LRE family protein [Rhodopirellula baltica]|uniref:Gluconolactonase n=1 Tax=Rhodopirellula baltica (strain DSM 10527 / NCIMB 13988 / SH1) TaxID=243090 RepID=Q7UXY1_RHOBA|nr:SMP-30/gluconolactonase/LRE family protein [Rhodopirellula baltica]CAD71870.1 gluconolactonase [Rhodopirellula baltica SH 1]HBE61467.1 SMP-30/gluconolactonase/LRE family protein [Rhodopirellula baltica]